MIKRLFGARPLLILVAGLVTLSLIASACAPASPSPASTQAPVATQQPIKSEATTAPTKPTVVTSATEPATGSPSSACPPTGSATSLNGAGATFPMPLYTRWFDEYNKMCGIKVNYQGIGSGGGIKQHTEKTVDFGASDGIMTDKQKQDAAGSLMIPMTAGAVAVIVNLPNIQNGQLKLTPETLSGIYLGKITKWNDPKVAADNSGLTLPDQKITVVRRADGSGTTNIFTTYLSQVSTEWKDKVGKGNSVQWPTGIGGEGNAGVAGQVRQIPGSIGYVELAYASQNKLTWTAVKNQAGNFVEPSLPATTAAMEGVEVPDSTEVMITNSANPDAYPIVGLTWIIVYENQKDKAKAQTLAQLLWWCVHDGQRMTADLEYAALSPKMVQKAEALIKKIKVDGQPVLR